MGIIVKLAYPHHDTSGTARPCPLSPRGATLYILEGYCPQTLGDYHRLAKMLKDEFPEVDMEKVECGQVQKSNLYDRFTLVGVSLVDIDRSRIKKPWYLAKAFKPDFYW